MNNKAGRLFGMRSYAIGPMDRVSEEEATEWRDDICNFLYSIGVIPLNPCIKQIHNVNEEAENGKYMERLVEENKYDEVSQLVRKDIRHPDLRCVDVSDFVIVNMSIKQHLCGSYEELFTTNKQKKPILVRVKEGKKNTPRWLFGTIPHQFIFNTFEEIKKYLLYVNDWNNEPETYRRWVFIDYYSLLKPLQKN